MSTTEPAKPPESALDSILSEAEIDAHEAQAHMIARSGVAYTLHGEPLNEGGQLFPEHSAHSVSTLAANLRLARSAIAELEGVRRTADEHIVSNANLSAALTEARGLVNDLSALRDVLAGQRDSATGSVLRLRSALVPLIAELPEVDPNDTETDPNEHVYIGPIVLTYQEIWQIRTAYKADAFTPHVRNLADDAASPVAAAPSLPLAAIAHLDQVASRRNQPPALAEMEDY